MKHRLKASWTRLFFIFLLNFWWFFSGMSWKVLRNHQKWQEFGIKMKKSLVISILKNWFRLPKKSDFWVLALPLIYICKPNFLCIKCNFFTGKEEKKPFFLPIHHFWDHKIFVKVEHRWIFHIPKAQLRPHFALLLNSNQDHEGHEFEVLWGT